MSHPGESHTQVCVEWSSMQGDILSNCDGGRRMVEIWKYFTSERRGQGSVSKFFANFTVFNNTRVVNIWKSLAIPLRPHTPDVTKRTNSQKHHTTSTEGGPTSKGGVVSHAIGWLLTSNVGWLVGVRSKREEVPHPTGMDWGEYREGVCECVAVWKMNWLCQYLRCNN